VIRRLLRALGLVLLATVLGLVAWNWTHLRAFPAILPAFTAKETCSCRFVMEQDAAYCTAYTEQWLPISEVTVDEAAKRVTARGLGVTRSAGYVGPREGCRLDP
jgi:hypothetical protein